MRSVRQIILAGIFFIPTVLLAEVRATGRILDRATGRPVFDASVAVQETGAALTTGPEGEFELVVPEPGYYTLRIYVADDLYQVSKEVRFNGEVITISVGQTDINNSGTSDSDSGVRVIGLRDQTRLSRFTLTNDEIKRLPGVYGDSLKAVTTLPGISPAPPVGALPTTNILTTSFLSGFSVGPPYSNSTSGVLVLRGAGARANQFYLDGFKIQYPFHLGDQSSVINNDYIQLVDVYTGTYPARYGNATGGVIAITGPGEVEKPGGHINVSLFLSDVYYETPIFGGLGYFVGTARKSYPNYALLAIYPEAIPANAKYADYLDGQYKLNIKFNNSHELLFTYFGARDILNYTKSVDELSSEESGGFLDGLGGGTNGGANTNTSGRPPVGLDRGFHTQGVRYTYTYEGMLKNDMYAQVSRFKEDFELDFRSPFTGETIFGYEVLDSRREFQYRDELSIGIIDDHLIANVGAEINKVRWELSLRNFSPQENINPNTPSFVETINDLVESNRTFRSLYDGDRTYYDLHAYYGELEIEFWRFRLTPGMRGEWYSLSHSTGVGPRAGLEFSIPESGTTLLAGTGRHFNVPPGLNYVSIEAGNPGLEMEAADHLAAGVDQELGDEWLIKLEVFRNIFRNLVVEDTYIVAPFSPRTNLREWATKPYDVASNPLENRPLNFSNDGTGWSEGFEIYIKKIRAPGSNGFFGWISYSNSLTKRNNHQPRLTDDQDSALRARNQGRNALIYREFDRNFLIYYDSNELEYYYDNDREELYDLDRTHQISLVINYKFNPEWQIGLRWQYATNVPYTPITGTQDLNLPILGRPTFIPEYSDFYNSERLGPVHQLDIRVDRFINYGWGYANFYMELINFYARRNPESTSFDFLYPYVRGTNPSVNYESTYIQTPVGGGRVLLLPLINFGMEIQF